MVELRFRIRNNVFNVQDVPSRRATIRPLSLCLPSVEEAALLGEVDEIGQLVLEPRRLVLPDRRHLLLARVKTQPRVQEITLPDRFDDRRSGAFKFQNEYPRRIQSARMMSDTGKVSMKAGAGRERPLTTA